MDRSQAIPGDRSWSSPSFTSCCVYKDWQGSVSQAKRGPWGPVNKDLTNMESLGKSWSSSMKSSTKSLLSLLQPHFSKWTSEVSRLPFSPCSLWLASSCFGSKEQSKLCVLLHTLVQACWDLRGWGISFSGEVTKSFGLRGTRAGQDRPGQTCPLPFELHSQRTVRERKRFL